MLQFELADQVSSLPLGNERWRTPNGNCGRRAGLCPFACRSGGVGAVVAERNAKGHHGKDRWAAQRWPARGRRGLLDFTTNEAASVASQRSPPRRSSRYISKIAANSSPMSGSLRIVSTAASSRWTAPTRTVAASRGDQWSWRPPHCRRCRPRAWKDRRLVRASITATGRFRSHCVRLATSRASCWSASAWSSQSCWTCCLWSMA